MPPTPKDKKEMNLFGVYHDPSSALHFSENAMIRDRRRTPETRALWTLSLRLSDQHTLNEAH